jgi:hypothetical protein
MAEVLRFRVEFTTSEEDCDELTGVIDDNKKVVEIIDLEDDKQIYRGFIPFSAIKKLEILHETDDEENEDENKSEEESS